MARTDRYEHDHEDDRENGYGERGRTPPPPTQETRFGMPRARGGLSDLWNFLLARIFEDRGPDGVIEAISIVSELAKRGKAGSEGGATSPPPQPMMPPPPMPMAPPGMLPPGPPVPFPGGPPPGGPPGGGPPPEILASLLRRGSQ